jgi:potassium-transporting ATPase KdpC subunit
MSYWRLAYACAMLAALTVIVCGIAYPVAITIVAGLAFPQGASGSPVYDGGTLVGSRLIGQDFTGPEYFHSRPSAVDYNASASGASNLGPYNPALIASVKERMENGSTAADAALASGSGLDPDISVDNAMAQAPRVALENGLDEEAIKGLVLERIQGRFIIWGEPRVNVLELNLAVKKMKESKGKV